MLASHTSRVTEVEEMFSTEDSLDHEYMLSYRWAVTKMLRSYESDGRLAYIHGFDAGIDLLCARARISNPAIAEGMMELAAILATETAKTLRSMLSEKERLLQSQPRSRRMTDMENDERKL